MKNNFKRFFIFGLIGLFLILFVSDVVSAVDPIVSDTTASAKGGTGVYGPITVNWTKLTSEWLNFGDKWVDFIVGLAILLMIFAATYDVLGFTAFEKEWTKYTIAGSIAVVTSLFGGINAIAAILMGIAGDSVALATTIAIIFAAVFFVIGSFFKGKMKAHQLRTDKDVAEAAFAIGNAKNKADIAAGINAIKEAKRK